MMLRRICFSIALGFLIPFTASTANAQVVGDTVKAVNTFEDSNAATNFTGGAEAIFGLGSTGVIDPGSEFSLFAGIYDIDFVEDGFSMTFLNNDSLGVDLYGAGTFDRYYFGFDGNRVDSISIAGGATELTNGLTVGTLAPGFVLNATDLFSTGIPVPQNFENGGFFLEFGEGTNYQDGTIGESVTFSFTTTAVPEPGSASLLGVFVVAGLLRRKRKA